MFLEINYKGAPITAGMARPQLLLREFLLTKKGYSALRAEALFEEHANLKFLSATWTQRKYWNFFCWFFRFRFGGPTDYCTNWETTQLVLWDMLGSYKSWRHCRGYPVNGQRTWSNGKSSTKNNVSLKNYRLAQFKLKFGVRKKSNYAVLIQAEAVNRLWLKTWPAEWLQGHLHALRSKARKVAVIPVDLQNLARGVSTGYIRRGQAEKWNKSKKALRTVTIGLPLFFFALFFWRLQK